MLSLSFLSKIQAKTEYIIKRKWQYQLWNYTNLIVCAFSANMFAANSSYFQIFISSKSRCYNVWLKGVCTTMMCKERLSPPKRMKSWKSFRGGDSVIFLSKIYVANFPLCWGYIWPWKMQVWMYPQKSSKNSKKRRRGEGRRLFETFPKNSTFLWVFHGTTCFCPFS